MSKASKLRTAIAAFNVSECVKDYEGNIMPAYLISTDLDTWKFLEVFNVDDFEKWIEFRHGFSDYHKSVYGSRPRWDTSGYTLSEWISTYASLERENEEVMEREAKQEVLDVDAFKKAVIKIRQSGAKDFSTALRWMLQADDVDRRNRQDVERFFWDHNILYSDYAKSLLNRICPIKR